MTGATTVIEQAAAIDGVLIVKKEAGWTSHDVVAKLRRLLGGVKVGHAGTLDPAATGVLPVLIGRATRLAEYLVEWDKEYRAVLRLGETTDTQDASGTVLSRIGTNGVSEEAIRQVVARFRGPQRQIPPMYSAVKIGGQPLYKAARAGQIVERQDRAIVIHRLDLVSINGQDVTLNVVCSKGTYIRTLCADMGHALGVGGHLLTLERRRVGPLSVDRALTVDQIGAALALGTLHGHLIMLDQLLEALPAVVVTDEQARRILHGAAVSPEGIQDLPTLSVSVRLKDAKGRLLAIGTRGGPSSEMIKIHKVLVDIDSLN